MSPSFLRVSLSAGALAIAMAGVATPTSAQGVDCQRLRAQIAQMDRGGGGGRGNRRLGNELARTQAAIGQLGCGRGGFSFFGGGDNPQCAGLQARAQQLQAALSQGGGGGGAGRNDLVASFNAYCREGAQPPRERGFFESIFGGGEPQRPAPLPDLPPPSGEDDGGGEGGHARGGSQAVCVRTCDGGFFPLALSSRHSASSLNEMCSALCPGTEAAVYTRSPDADIKTAVSLEGKPYSEMPNALKFTKNYSDACSCRPAGKSWAETLANAEQVLGNQRKGDILVTQQKSDELSRPKFDPKAQAALLAAPGTTKVSPEEAGKLAANPPALRDSTDVTDPDGTKRAVRRVGPQN